MKTKPYTAWIAIIGSSLFAVAVGSFSWGQWVGWNDARALAAHEPHPAALAMGARGACGAGAELARSASGYLCIWHYDDNTVVARRAGISAVAGQ